MFFISFCNRILLSLNIVWSLKVQITICGEAGVNDCWMFLICFMTFSWFFCVRSQVWCTTVIRWCGFSQLAAQHAADKFSQSTQCALPCSFAFYISSFLCFILLFISEAVKRWFLKAQRGQMLTLDGFHTVYWILGYQIWQLVDYYLARNSAFLEHCSTNHLQKAECLPNSSIEIILFLLKYIIFD